MSHAPEGHFSTVEASRIAGVSAANANYWSRTLARATVEATGMGRPRGYSRQDVVWLAAVGRLREAGLDPRLILKLRSAFYGAVDGSLVELGIAIGIVIEIDLGQVERKLKWPEEKR